MNHLHHTVRAAFAIAVVLASLGCAPSRRPDTPDVDALIAELAMPVSDICAHDPELCARACAGCPDVDACLKANGVCAADQDYFIDVRDGGLSVFVPGCHMRYQDNACSVNGAFFFTDRCVGDTLYEWWNPACHPGIGDMVSIDCRKLCVLMRRPGGTCEYIADVCPGNQASGRCICDPPPVQP
jgi:hypothetical protein